MSIRASAPFSFFTDASGEPLSAGFVYIGVANLDPVSHPIAVFSDAALTVSVAQPIRTQAGVPVVNGTPVNLFVGGNYSMTVKDRNNVQVYTVPSAALAGGDITLASGETLEAQSGSTIDVKDGAIVNLGDGTGAGASIVVAATTRITGDLVAAAGDALGTPAETWGAAHIDDVLCETLAFGNDAQPSGADLGSLNRRTMTLALARQTSATTTAATTNIYNVSSISRFAQGIYDVTLTIPVDDLANITVQVQPHLNGVTSAWLDGSSTTSVLRVSFFDPVAVAQINTPFCIEVKGFIPG